MEAFVKARSGSVLGKGSILKMYFFPGQRTSSHIQIHGAPHVYKVSLHDHPFVGGIGIFHVFYGLSLFAEEPCFQTLIVDVILLFVSM
jgi:hypothetical protein